MSLDSSLKSSSGLTRHRNVLTRAERIARMVEKGSFDIETGKPLGMLKTGNRKLKAAGKSKKKDDAAAAS